MPILVDRNQVLRYLNYKNQEIDTRTNNLINESIKEIQDKIMAKTIYREFEIVRTRRDLYIKGSEFALSGASIKNHLKDSSKCILIGFTLGHEVDKLIRYYEKINMAKAIILDTCGSAAIEEFADNICSSLEEDYGKNGQSLTSRFSPGYGDLDISIQGSFLNLLDARKSIGLTSTSHSILIPRKSVTAIIGILHGRVKQDKASCKNCNKYNTCIYAKGDDGCGN